MKFMKRLFLLVVLILGIFAWCVYRYPLATARIIPLLPSIERLPLSSETPKTVVKGKDVLLVPIPGKYAISAELPLILTQAITSIEDERFYSHRGIDFFGVARAIFTNLSKQRFAEGASTITQQLARNLFLSQDLTARRKIVEAILALQLEDYYHDKNKILELYLNNIYYGRNAWGIKQASETYFHGLKSLSVPEAAYLVGLPQAPSAYGDNASAAMSRQKAVIQKMKELGFIRADLPATVPVVKE